MKYFSKKKKKKDMEEERCVSILAELQVTPSAPFSSLPHAPRVLETPRGPCRLLHALRAAEGEAEPVPLAEARGLKKKNLRPGDPP